MTLNPTQHALVQIADRRNVVTLSDAQRECAGYRPEQTMTELVRLGVLARQAPGQWRRP
jgi:hypothetical protein